MRAHRRAELGWDRVCLRSSGLPPADPAGSYWILLGPRPPPARGKVDHDLSRGVVDSPADNHPWRAIITSAELTLRSIMYVHCLLGSATVLGKRMDVGLDGWAVGVDVDRASRGRERTMI